MIGRHRISVLTKFSCGEVEGRKSRIEDTPDALLWLFGCLSHNIHEGVFALVSVMCVIALYQPPRTSQSHI